MQHVGGMEEQVRFVVECGLEKKKGIHLRNWAACKPVARTVNLEPFMLDEARAGGSC